MPNLEPLGIWPCPDWPVPPGPGSCRKYLQCQWTAPLRLCFCLCVLRVFLPVGPLSPKCGDLDRPFLSFQFRSLEPSPGPFQRSARVRKGEPDMLWACPLQLHHSSTALLVNALLEWLSVWPKPISQSKVHSQRCQLFPGEMQLPTLSLTLKGWRWKSLSPVRLWILVWVAFAFSRGSSQPRDQTQVSCMRADSLPAEPQGKPKNTAVGSLSLLQGIFPTQRSNPGLPHCGQILYQLSYQGSPWHWKVSPFHLGILVPWNLMAFAAFWCLFVIFTRFFLIVFVGNICLLWIASSYPNAEVEICQFSPFEVTTLFDLFFFLLYNLFYISLFLLLSPLFSSFHLLGF